MRTLDPRTYNTLDPMAKVLARMWLWRRGIALNQCFLVREVGAERFVVGVYEKRDDAFFMRPSRMGAARRFKLVNTDEPFPFNRYCGS